MAKVMVSLPEDLLAEIDRVANETGRTRSGLLQYVWRLYQLERPGGLTPESGRVPPGDRPGVREAWARAREAMANARFKDNRDSTEIVREARDKLDARDRERMRRGRERSD